LDGRRPWTGTGVGQEAPAGEAGDLRQTLLRRAGRLRAALEAIEARVARLEARPQAD
jgi:hypothetical protein